MGSTYHHQTYIGLDSTISTFGNGGTMPMFYRQITEAGLTFDRNKVICWCIGNAERA